MKLIEDIIRENVNQVINEYADKYYLKPLFNYFNMTDEEKDKNSIYEYIQLFQNFLEENEDEIYNKYDLSEEEIEDLKDRSDDYDESLADEIINGKYSYFKEDFLEYLKNYFWQNSYDSPAYDTMAYPKYLHNAWLIHFSDNAAEIAENGFAYGTQDMENLAYSGCGTIKNKFGEGYDFAFDVDKFDKYYRGGIGGKPKYGSEAVIFQASGVELTHFGDQEDQVVFWGPSAKNFIYIEYDSDYGWCVKSIKNYNILYYNEDLEMVVYWAINNYDQYQRQMVNYKANKRFRNYETNYNS